MGLLSSFWRFIDIVIIPYEGGQRRWLVLSYLVHPVILVHCRFYLMAKAVVGLVLVVFYYQIRVARWVVTASFGLMMRTVEKLVLIMELDDASIIRKYGIGAPRERWFDFLATEEDDDEDPRQSIVLYNTPRLFPSKAAAMSIFENVSSDGCEEEEEIEEAEQEEKVTEEAEWHPVVLPELEEDDETGGENRRDQVVLPEPEEDDETEGENRKERVVLPEPEEDEEITLATTSDVDDGDTDAGSSSLSLSKEAMPIRQTRRGLVIETEEDEFYKDYMKKMNVFDLINGQAIFGVSSTAGVDLGSPAQLETIVRRMHTLTGSFGKDVVGSLVSSVETAYVAQSCLSWEALHHQYRKVETLVSSAGAGECAFLGDPAAKFQHFQVLLRRFMESDRLQGRRIGNYSWERLSSGFLLQVPGVEGYVVDARETQSEESLKGWELLKVVEGAITTFQDFLGEDDFNQRRMKLKKPSSADAPVENPNDLPLLSKLLKKVNKKEVGIKDLSKRKNRWWEKEKEKSKVLAGMGRSNELLFAAIDVKLVSRVLNMSNVSTLQLKWCEDKLNAIQIYRGFIVRNSTAFLFPCS